MNDVQVGKDGLKLKAEKMVRLTAPNGAVKEGTLALVERAVGNMLGSDEATKVWVLGINGKGSVTLSNGCVVEVV